MNQVSSSSCGGVRLVTLVGASLSTTRITIWCCLCPTLQVRGRGRDGSPNARRQNRCDSGDDRRVTHADGTLGTHAHFKAVTSSSPLQYLKNVRLHRARMLMVHEGATTATAASRVGYESASQFSREFKRLFGGGPAAIANQQRTSLIRLA